MNNKGMMKQLLQMQKELKKTQKELEKDTVTGVAGDGIVEVVLTGTQKFHAVKLDKKQIESISTAELEKMIGVAIKDALNKSRKLMADKLGPLGGGMPGMKP